MSTRRIAFLAACILTIWFQHPSPAADPVRVMTFNIRYGTAKDGENHWDNRKDFLIDTIKAFDPDLLGSQETLGFQRDYLAEQLPGYGVLGVGRDDGPEDVAYVAGKIRDIRVFEGENEKPMDRSVTEVAGSVLVVSQFTLYGDAEKGRRPSFIDAARPEVAIPLYEGFVKLLRERGLTVETGEFGAMMEVDLVNDGPVTLWLER